MNTSSSVYQQRLATLLRVSFSTLVEVLLAGHRSGRIVAGNQLGQGSIPGRLVS